MFWIMHSFQEAVLDQGSVFSVDELCLLYSQSHKKIRTVKKMRGEIKNKEMEYTCYFDPKQVHDSLVHTDISTGMLAL